ncbi:MAG: nucleotide exchange factor GrpE [Alphaproteobacteria bacterium]|nr:nucleotide exchange factor GrpE [Alphaproteobacteria bacterium]MBQ7127984.1 nucleotide exchange factor GrpE [Alphaproteobacteria bacterium]
MHKDENKEVEIESVSINDAPANEDIDVAKLQDDLAQMNDKYLRLAAELENTRRRAALDAESRARNRAMGVAEKILPVMDAVDAALKHNPDDAGIQSMARALESAFAQIGITKIESIGEKLNPMFHNAIQVVESPDAETNTIVDEMQTGYMFGDTILRTAMVVVAK